MDSLQTISNDLVESINEKEKKKAIPYDTYAKVIRIDGGTAWVHIPGGVDETPVALTVNAKVGDSVLVRVSGGNAWIVGNSSAPPTDDTKAVEAKGVADVAQVKAASAQETAESAEEIAKDASRTVKSTSQHFWHTETDTGAGAGAHITEVPQEDFLDDPANGGGNLLAQSGGVYIRDGVDVNAQFTPAKLIIGDYTYSGNIYNSQFILDNSSGSSLITCRYWDSANQQFNQGRSLMYWNGNRGQTLEFMSYDFASSDEYDAELVIGQDDYGDATTKGIEAQSYKYVPGTGYSGVELRMYPQSVKVRRIGTTSGGNKSRTDVVEIDTSGNIDMAGKLQSFFSIVNLEVAVGSVAAHAQNNIGTVTVPSADRPDGMTLVGIVGVACNNYRVVPYNYYVNGAHSITCAVVNTTTAQSAAGTTMTFKLLYAKMASA